MALVKRQTCFALLGLLGVVLCAFGILTVLYFQDLITIVIHRELQMRNGTDPLKFYVNPPVRPKTSVYFFNLTNPDEVLEGAVPSLVEVGPYVYVEEWSKVVDKFDDVNNTLTWRLKTIKHFDAAASKGREDDLIMTANVPMMAAVYRMKYGSTMMRVAMSSMFTTILKVSPFMQFKVGDLLWGYEDPLLKLAKDLMPPGQSPPFEKFGFLYETNGTSRDNLTTFTGVGDVTRKGLISAFNGASHLTFWAEDSCNLVQGSDGSGFPPDVDVAKPLYFFNPRLCRSLPLTYDSDVYHQGIRTARMTPPEDVFDVAQPDNACFCLDPPDCSPRGLFNVSACQFGSPVYVSWPHFFQADERLLQAVHGLRPDKSKHQFYVDMETKLGLPMSVAARLQINIQLQSIWEIKQTRNMRNLTFPLMWMDSGIEDMPEAVYSLVRMATETPEVAEAAATYTLFILGAVLVLVVAAFFVHQKVTIGRRRSKMDTSTSTTTMDGLIRGGGGGIVGATNGAKVVPVAVGGGGGGGDNNGQQQHQNGAKNGASPALA